MKKTLTTAACALALAVGSIAIQSPAFASPAWSNPARTGSDTSALITTVAATATTRSQNTALPQQQEEQQDYPKYHNSPTASYMSPTKPNPCHFTQALVEGSMKQVEVCS